MPFSEFPVFQGPLLGGRRGQSVGQYMTRAPLRGPDHRRPPPRPTTVSVPPEVTVTAWPKGQGPGALRWAGPGRAREGRGPTSQAAVSPMAAPALFPASTNIRQTKSLFLPILNPVPLPSPPSAKVKTRNWKAWCLERVQGWVSLQGKQDLPLPPRPQPGEGPGRTGLRDPL